MTAPHVEITVFTKANGPLTKRISLDANGKLISDGSACTMGRGSAKRAKLASVNELATLIETLKSNEAIGLGTLRPDLGDECAVVTKTMVESGERGIARTGSNFSYTSPAVALLDYDTKAMPDAVKALVRDGFWPALVTVVPDLGTVGHVIRSSTSAGLTRADTGEAFAGSGGCHGYIMVKDGGDVERFLTTLHERCWLAGLGWYMVGAAGQLLERSIVDRMVGAPERLVFEGPPIIEPPLQQANRKPLVMTGDILDSLVACPPLTVVEKQTLEKMKAITAQHLMPERNRAREAFIASQAQRLQQRTGMTAAAAAATVEKQTRGILLASVELPFDNGTLQGMTVGDVLDDPALFEGETLADPIEGVAYGICKAKVMRGAEGVFINSFAHGGAFYQLKYDATAISRKIAAATTPSDVLETFVRLAMLADLSAVELHDLTNEVKRRTNLGVKLIQAALKEAKQALDARRKAAADQRKQAGRNDPRPTLLVQPDDAPLTEEMARINTIIRQAPLAQQIRRDMEGCAVKARWKPVPNTHAFSSDENKDADAPEQWTIGRLDEYGLTEELERLMDYVDDDGRSVAPPGRLVKAYTQRDDQILHVLAAIATQPIVLADGVILGREGGFEKTRGIQFIVPKAIAALVPKPDDCTPEAVAKAMTYLTDDWMVDVATDYTGKCVTIASALTIMERSLLPERPVFMYIAGRASAGKTTAIKMVIAAVTGGQVAAAAWSMNDEERRKAITTYFLQGVAYILWDNIPRGHQISCPHIERSCTAAYWADRLLGVNEMVATSAATIHMFTGNNIGAKGDTATRSLKINLVADRHDPENREFKHPDIVGWTLANRDKILGALFTILLGNPQLKAARDAQMRTRFPMWWRLVGAAVEHAAEQAVAAGNAKATPISFEKLFLKQRADDDEDATLSEVLLAMATYNDAWRTAGFSGKQVAEAINGPLDTFKSLLREFLYADKPAPEVVNARSVGKRLAANLDNTVSCAVPKVANGVTTYEQRDAKLKVIGTEGGGKGGNIYGVVWLDGQPAPRAIL